MFLFKVQPILPAIHIFRIVQSDTFQTMEKSKIVNISGRKATIFVTNPTKQTDLNVHPSTLGLNISIRVLITNVA